MGLTHVYWLYHGFKEALTHEITTIFAQIILFQAV